MLMTDKLLAYYGKDDWPSNFFEEPVSISLFKSKESYIFPTGEHAFQACKAAFFNDPRALRKLLETDSPWQAMQIGRSVRNFDFTQWEERSFDAMVHVLKARLNSSPMLLANALEVRHLTFIEASPTNFKWGCGLTKCNPDILHLSKHKGLNLQGKAWNTVIDLLP